MDIRLLEVRRIPRNTWNADTCYLQTGNLTDCAQWRYHCVIDFILEESDGWGMVDYKTDDVNESQIDSVVESYRSQLETYESCWTSITGHQCKELGLNLTRLTYYQTLKQP